MMASSAGVFVLLCILASVGWAVACPYDYVIGEWEFHVGNGRGDGWTSCDAMGLTDEMTKVKLLYPDLATDEFGNRGFWTMISAAGIAVAIHGRSFTAFLSYIDEKEGNVTTYCSETRPGWTHEVDGHDWACYKGYKTIPNTEPPYAGFGLTMSDDVLDQMYEHDAEFIEQINAAQSLWTAGRYPEYEQMTIRELRMRDGWKLAENPQELRVMKASRELKDRSAKLPDNFDWRNVDGVNYVTPVRHQGRCGSCYAFASVAMNEARLLIHTRNDINVTLSPQDVVDCSPYSNGCGGGYPYLIAGKYGEDFGMVEESCNPYRANETGICETDVSCRKHYFTGKQYIGGYFGAGNEEAMRISLVENGPFVLAMLATSEFKVYQGGIYKVTGVARKFDPFMPVNHAVTLVGYGVDEETGTKFWSVKNSWGTGWGEQGYFRIVRGTNELSIESGASEAFPIF